jgi:hypothetical protein
MEMQAGSAFVDSKGVCWPTRVDFFQSSEDPVVQVVLSVGCCLLKVMVALVVDRLSSLYCLGCGV